VPEITNESPQQANLRIANQIASALPKLECEDLLSLCCISL